MNTKAIEECNFTENFFEKCMYSCGGFFSSDFMWNSYEPSSSWSTAIQIPSLDLGQAAVSITDPTNEL